MSNFKYGYAGNRTDFINEFGGESSSPLRFSTMIMITLFVLLIIVIITAYFLLKSEPEIIFTDRNTLYNLGLLDDVNNGEVECCIAPGKTAPNRQYVYDGVQDITYSRDKPTNITTVCALFADPVACASENTNSEGEIIPVITFESLPYFTFEKGLFIGCASTTPC
jgi:hypothetical protein